jgi:hypothetical protein
MRLIRYCMPYLGNFLVCLLLSEALGGCSLFAQNDPGRYTPKREVLNSIATVGVLKPSVAGYTTQNPENDVDLLEESKSAAFSGALLLASPLAPAATVYLLYAAGSVGEASVAPTAVKDSQKLQTNQASLDTYNKVLTVMVNDNATLQSALVSEGRRLPAYSFIPIDGEERLAKLGNNGTRPTEGTVDALLQVSDLSVVFIKNSASYDDDPILELNVSLKLELKNTDLLPRCLGWYTNTWEGKRLRLSAWAENDGEELKDGIALAFQELSQEALNYLFTPRHEFFRLSDEKVVAPNWVACSVNDPYERISVDPSYCPLADQGYVDYQSRIGSVFFNESHLSRRNLVYAYVWYSRAARHNDKNAADRIRLLSSMLTSDELEEAEIELNEWRPGQCIDELSNAGLIRPR